jgi:hypothetical protein
MKNERDYDKERANALLDMCEAEKKVAESEAALITVDYDEMSAAHAEEVGLNAVYADLIKKLQADNEILAGIVVRRGEQIEAGQKQLEQIAAERNNRENRCIELGQEMNRLAMQLGEATAKLARRAKNARRRK